MSTLYLLADICGETAAFDAAAIQSVIELERITPAPRAPRHIAGLTGLRSRSLAVVDCAAAMGLPQTSADDMPGRKAAIVEIGGHGYALLLDGVQDIFETAAEQDPSPKDLGPGWARVARGVINSPAGPVLVLDPAALINTDSDKIS